MAPPGQRGAASEHTRGARRCACGRASAALSTGATKGARWTRTGSRFRARRASRGGSAAPGRGPGPEAGAGEPGPGPEPGPGVPRPGAGAGGRGRSSEAGGRGRSSEAGGRGPGVRGRRPGGLGPEAGAGARSSEAGRAIREPGAPELRGRFPSPGPHSGARGPAPRPSGTGTGRRSGWPRDRCRGPSAAGGEISPFVTVARCGAACPESDWRFSGPKRRRPVRWTGRGKRSSMGDTGVEPVTSTV